MRRGFLPCLPVVDLQTLPKGQRKATAQDLASGEAERTFDLARGPLWRVILIRLDTAEHVLLVNHHHIISDGWSQSVFNRELATLYEDWEAVVLRARCSDRFAGVTVVYNVDEEGALPSVETFFASSDEAPPVKKDN